MGTRAYSTQTSLTFLPNKGGKGNGIGAYPYAMGRPKGALA
jgi:hypothetical protein